MNAPARLVTTPAEPVSLPDMNQDNPFAALAKTVLPEQTSGRLARLGNVDQRTAQRWMSGAIEPPAEIKDKLQQQRAALETTDLRIAFETTTKQALSSGIDIEVFGSWMAAWYEHVMLRKIK